MSATTVQIKKTPAKKPVTKNVKKPKSFSAVKTANEKKSPAIVQQEQQELLMQPPRGMRDLLPGDQPYWDRVRRILSTVCQEYGFQRIDTPTLEYAHIFLRSIGEGTDVIDKEMYTFTTRGGDRVALRPEMTSGIARAYIQHGMSVLPKPIRLFSKGPLFRYDRPQEGRYREHWQANFDIFGEKDPIIDAQIFQMAYRVVSYLGLKNIEFQVNSIGTPTARKEYNRVLVRYFETQRNRLCQNCRERLETNPLRILDCKEDKCVQLVAVAPQMKDYLEPESKEHFRKLLEYLDELEIPYTINPRLVRGLDYYTDTVFEIYTRGQDDTKKQSLGGGGRYDGLIAQLGGESTPAIGFGLGMDRLVLEMQRHQVKLYYPPRPKIFLAQLGELAKKKSLRLFGELEKNGVLVAESFGRGSLKSQLRAAHRMGAEITLILGQKEAIDGTVILKDMVSGTQETVTQGKLMLAVKKMLKTNQTLHIDAAQLNGIDDDDEED
ncbi:MAG: histidine--tRNA ligase [Candidatus Moraniibacteriota bacterium]